MLRTVRAVSGETTRTPSGRGSSVRAPSAETVDLMIRGGIGAGCPEPGGRGKHLFPPRGRRGGGPRKAPRVFFCRGARRGGGGGGFCVGTGPPLPRFGGKPKPPIRCAPRTDSWPAAPA